MTTYEEEIASLPSVWAIKTLSEIASIFSGGTPSRAVPRFWGGQIPWVTPGELTSLPSAYLDATREQITTEGLANSGAVLLPTGALIVTSRATLGSVAILTRPAATNQGFKSLVFRASDEGFYYYLFGRLQSELKRLASGTTFLEISSRDFSSIQVPEPPQAEQSAIECILCTIDRQIQRTEDLVAKLKLVKQGLLHDLLTRGIDDNGELRDPDRHPEQFKNSPLGRIPKGWTVHPLATAAEIRSGIAKNSNKAVSNPIWVHYLRVANVQDGFLDLSEMSEIRVGRDDVERYAVKNGDVLMNEGGDLDKLGRGAIWRGQYNPCVHQNHVFVVRCGASLLPDFLDAWTGSSSARRYFMMAGKQTTNLASINKKALGRLPIVVLPLAEQQAVVRNIQRCDFRVLSESDKLAKLRLLKQALMDDLLTGRVRVTPLLEGQL